MVDIPKRYKVHDYDQKMAPALCAVVASLILVSALGENVNAADRLGYTALHHAAVAGKTEEVERLIAAGANVNALGEYDWTPLILAANNGHCPVIRILLDAGALPDVIDKTGHTAMQYAADNGYVEAVEILLEAGADHSISNHVRDAFIR